MTNSAASLAQDYTVVFHNTDRRFFVDSPGLVRLAKDEWVATVAVTPRTDCFDREALGEQRVSGSRVHIVRSRDDGTSWQPVTALPYYAVAPWQYDGALYLFVNKGGRTFRNDDFLLLRSEDGGSSWSEPVTLFEGHYWNCHTSMVKRDGRLYWATDDLSPGENERGPCVVVGDLSGDLMDPASWRMSNTVPYPGIPDQLINSAFADLPSRYLEPNVIDIEGRLRILAAVKPKRQTTTGLCAVFDITDDGETVDLSFRQYHPMPGGQLKFDIVWDDISRMFWAVLNLAADGQDALGWHTEEGRPGRGSNDRRFLMLYYGVDGLNWFPAGCVARAGKLSQSFMYPKLVIDDDDLGIISRSSVDAPNRHDADYATFHRVRNFRDLAMDLRPDSE